MVFFLSVWVLLTPDRILTFPRWISHIIKTISYSGELKTSWGMSVWRKRMLCSLVVKVRHENNVCLCSTIVIFRPVMKVDHCCAVTFCLRQCHFDHTGSWRAPLARKMPSQKWLVYMSQQLLAWNLETFYPRLEFVSVPEASVNWISSRNVVGLFFFNPLRIKTLFVKDKTDNDCRPTVEHKSQLEHNKKEWVPFLFCFSRLQSWFRLLIWDHI